MATGNAKMTTMASRAQELLQLDLQLKRSPDLFFAEWMAPRDMDRDDPDGPRLANPSHGVVHKQRDMDRERRAATTPDALAIFEADFLGWGVYPPDDSEREPVFPLELWQAMEDKAPELVGDTVMAVHRTLDRRLWAIAAGRRTTAGKVHVEVGYMKASKLPEVALFLTILIELFDPAAIIVDGRSTANVLVARMADLGFEVYEASTPNMAKACGGFVDAALAGELSHVGQPILEDALKVVDKRELPMGDFVWNDAEAGVPQWMATTLAHWGVLMFAEELGESASPAMSEDAHNLDEIDLLEAAF
jgi:hypothetical protein